MERSYMIKQKVSKTIGMVKYYVKNKLSRPVLVSLDYALIHPYYRQHCMGRQQFYCFKQLIGTLCTTYCTTPFALLEHNYGTQ